MENPLDVNLAKLLTLLYASGASGAVSVSGEVARDGTSQGELFGSSEGKPSSCIASDGTPGETTESSAFITELKRASPSAYDDFLHAWLSELPVESELLAFGRSVIGAARSAQGNRHAALPVEPSGAARYAAEKARTDRGATQTTAVLAAAALTRREYHRLLGLLRFRPSTEGPLVARCAPDHLVLPLMAGHFSCRFGESSWAVVDEQRSLSLFCLPPEKAHLAAFDPANPPFESNYGIRRDEYEALWRGYYQAVNIENRANSELRKRLMPLRYWRYLVEL